jgi:group I intron endonuclease
MKLIFHDKGNEGGIYKIINLQNGRIYIGSTYRFKDRARGHKTELEAGRHLNKFLQNDYNKCGSEAFLFEVIETVMGDRKTRVEREQFHIDQWYDNQKNCYNLVPYAMDSRGGSRNKKQIDPLTDGRCKPFSEDRLAKHAEKAKLVWQDPELKDLGKQNAMKRWNKHSANIKVRNIQTGEEVLITGSIRQWCKDVGVSYKAFHQLVKGKLNKSGGWALAIETS